MKRIYESGTSDSVTLFIGSEVEHTPMYGKKTLFVVGVHPTESICETANYHGIEHIYVGANQSFEPTEEWEELVQVLLKEKYWVTLDFDIKHVEWVLECGFTETNRFIPMVSAKLPYIDQLGYNACLKLDDRDFDATNPGVWTHRLHNLKDPAVFTDWSKYTKDETLD
jgi:hypothetical protein